MQSRASRKRKAPNNARQVQEEAASGATLAVSAAAAAAAAAAGGVADSRAQDADGDVAMGDGGDSAWAIGTAAGRSKRRKKEVDYAELEAQEEDADCVCGEGDDGGRAMIGCDGCGRWLHLECVGLTEDSPELEADGYECPVCVEEARRKRKQRSKRSRRGRSSSSSSKRSKSEPAPKTKEARVKAMRAKLKKTAATEVRRELELRGELVARTGKKVEMIEALLKLHHGMEQPAAMATVVGSEHLLNLILLFVAPSDLFQCAFVSKLWRRTAIRPDVWIQHLPAWGSLVEFPPDAGLGQAAKASALAAAYLNLYEPGYMCVFESGRCECAVVVSDDVTRMDVVDTTTGTMFVLRVCLACSGGLPPRSVLMRRYRLPAQKLLHSGRKRRWYNHTAATMHRRVASVLGGVTNARAHREWRESGGRVGNKPAFEFELERNGGKPRWPEDKPPFVMPLPQDVKRVVSKPIVAAALEKLRAAGVEQAEEELAHAHEGKLRCLHDGCDEVLALANDTHWFQSTLLCERGCCSAEHCAATGGLCPWHDMQTKVPEMKRRRMRVPPASAFVREARDKWVEGGGRFDTCCCSCWNKYRASYHIVPSVFDSGSCAMHLVSDRYGYSAAGLPAEVRAALVVPETLCLSCIQSGVTTAIAEGCTCRRCEACCLGSRVGTVCYRSGRRPMLRKHCQHWPPLLPILQTYAWHRASHLTGHQVLELPNIEASVQGGEACSECFADKIMRMDTMPGRTKCAMHHVAALYKLRCVPPMSDEQLALAATCDSAPCLACLRKSSVLQTEGVCRERLCKSCCRGGCGLEGH